MKERAYRTPEIVDDNPELRGRLHAIWETEPGIKGWFSTVDHKALGLRYIVTAFILLAIGGIEALVIRLQLAGPDLHLLTPQEYDQFFSMHGMTMIFLYAVPVLSGFSIYIWPLMFGTRDMAFPRMNALSYWVYLAAAAFMYSGFVIGDGANDGWFNYVPYAERDFNPGLNQDFYSLGMIFLGISTTLGAANFVATFFKMRAPGMSIARVPIFGWGSLTANAANLVVVPSVSLAFFLLWLDRQFGTGFYKPAEGGQPMLWQHLFWIFGHPWVYAIVLPAMSMVSEGLPVFCRRPLVGFPLVALSTVATMIFGFGVWVHHMFATGLPGLSMAFFSGASFLITFPTMVSIMAWIATIWLGRPLLSTAFLFFSSTIILLIIGGVSGVMTGAVASDWQLTDTYFVVAHLHYTLVGINVFPVIGGLYYWFPKMSGRLLDERLGRWSFWIAFLGFNLAFLPMHLTGLFGMPRRIYTYPAGMGWDALNLVTTIGGFIFALGVLITFFNCWKSMRSGASAGDNPWGAPTLEWATTSPPPPYNFAVIPTVASRHPLWEDQLDEDPSRSSIRRGMSLDDGKEAIMTSPIDGEPERIVKMPDDSIAPFLLTLAILLFFVGLLLRLFIVAAIGLAAVIAALIFWNWPRRELLERKEPAHG